MSSLCVASLSAGAVRSLALYCTLVDASPRSRQRQHTYRTMLTDSTRYCTAPSVNIAWCYVVL